VRLQSVLAPLLITMLCGAAAQSAQATVAESMRWPEWDAFVERFTQADGRIIDVTFDAKSTSEGQSYGMFFALVANRRDQFDRFVKWTSDNLSDSQLGDKLPAWLWGKRADGSWGVKDKNSAADADLWIAYCLLEAARLWNAPEYERLGRKVLARTRQQQIAQMDFGPVLTPGYGFELSDGRRRLNPSYWPGFMFRYFSVVDSHGPWQSMWDGYLRMAPKLFRAGVAPDLFVADGKGQVAADPERGPVGSYDAIRVYLWAGMSGENSRELVRLLARYSALLRKSDTPPEKVNAQTGGAQAGDFSPLGFSGALLPFLHAAGEKELLERQLRRIQLDAWQAKFGRTTHYYDQVLILFGKGWHDGYYRFDAQGQLVPKWRQ
jgi:endoglucanase